MNDPLSRVLLGWGDSRWYRWPINALWPRPEQRMSLGLVMARGIRATLVWFAVAAVLIRLYQAWPSSESLLVLGLLGAMSSLLRGFMVQLAWNRRAAVLKLRVAAGGSATAATVRSGFERFVIGPIAAFAILLLAYAMWTAVENIRGDLALRGFHAQLKAKGVPVTIEDLVPPPVPDDRNLALAPLFKPLLDYGRNTAPQQTGEPSTVWHDTNGLARIRGAFQIEDPKTTFATFDGDRRRADAKAKGVKSSDPGRNESWVNGARIDLETRQAYYRSLANWPRSETPQTPGKDVLLALGGSDAVLAELRAAVAERPQCRFPLRYADGFEMLLPHLADLKRIASFLRLRSAALLAEGRTDEALADTLLGLRLSNLVANEPILISSLVRVAMDTLMLQPVWEGCQDHRWNDHQLAALQAALKDQGRDYLGEMRHALDGERVLSGVAYDALAARELKMLRAMSDSGSEDSTLAWFIWLAPHGWVRQNQLAHARYLRALVDDLAAAQSHADLPPEGQRLDEFIKRGSLPLFTLIANLLAPAVDRASDRSHGMEANRRLALVGLALERHRLAAGNYPASLEALAPKFIDQVPNDPMIGAPLRYEPSPETGFRLYSVGLNHRDDGGVNPPAHQQGATDPRRAAADLVWQ